MTYKFRPGKLAWTHQMHLGPVSDEEFLMKLPNCTMVKLFLGMI